MPSPTENRNIWGDYDWSGDGDEWSANWGSTRLMWLRTLLPRIDRVVPCDHIVEIAPGFGRWSQYLKDLCSSLTLVDVTPICVESCKERFAAFDHVHCYENDGMHLGMVDDRSADFVFSFDSLVHADAETLRSYAGELSVKLSEHGVAFLHHSNLGEYRDESGKLTIDNPHGRCDVMRSDLWRDYCQQADLHCISQELINWGNIDRHDCISLTTRPGSRFAAEYQIQDNSDFMKDAARTAKIASLFGG